MDIGSAAKKQTGIILQLLAAKKRFSRRWSASVSREEFVRLNSSGLKSCLKGADFHGNRVYKDGDKSASEKANDVNNAKKVKAYMDKVYTDTDKSTSGKANEVNNIKRIKAYMDKIVTTAAEPKLPHTHPNQIGVGLELLCPLYYEIMSSPERF
ncbi:Uncharacterized protein Rs2_19585 [Raphanus sativus]|nr:Uncharacterized protein Rs2_19585 [Raphanus sativus]